MKTVVLYPGRFQPMLPHHAEVYRHLQSEFPDAEVYITTSNKVEAGKSPFDANDKIEIMTDLHGIPQDRILITKSPYNWKEYENSFDANNTKLIFVVGGKDMEGNPRFNFNPLKDGSPSYLQMINTNSTDALPMNKRGYVYTAPTIGDSNEAASASAFRQGLLTAPDLDSAKEVFTKAMGEFNQRIFDLVYDKITGKIMKESLETLKKLAGLLDEAPVNFSPGKGTMDYEPGVSSKDQKSAAERPAKAAASDSTSVGFTKIGPDDMISVDTGKPINSKQRAKSMANQFPDGADINDPAVKKEQFLKLLARSPGYVLGEINARLANDENGFAVSDRLSNIIDNLPEGGVMGLDDEDRKWTLSLVNNAINNMTLYKKDAELDNFDDEPELPGLDSLDDEEPEIVSLDDPEYADEPEDDDELEMEETNDLNDLRKRAGLDVQEDEASEDHIEKATDQYQEYGEQGLVEYLGLSSEDWNNQLEEYCREHNLHIDDDRDTAIHGMLEQMADDADLQSDADRQEENVNDTTGVELGDDRANAMQEDEAELNDIRQMAGLERQQVSEGGECYHCDGTGVHQDEDGENYDCEKCNGSGYVSFDDDPQEPGQDEIDDHEAAYKKYLNKDTTESLDLSTVVESIVGEQRIDELNFGKIKNVIMQKIASKFGKGEHDTIEKRITTSYKNTGEGEYDSYITVDGEKTYGPFSGIEDFANAMTKISNSLIMNKDTSKFSHKVLKPLDPETGHAFQDPKFQQSVRDLGSKLNKADVDALPVKKESAPEQQNSEMSDEELHAYVGQKEEDLVQDMIYHFAPDYVGKDNFEERYEQYREEVLLPAAKDVSMDHAEGPAETEENLDEFKDSNVIEPEEFDDKNQWIIVDNETGKEKRPGDKFDHTNPPATIVTIIPPTPTTEGSVYTDNGTITRKELYRLGYHLSKSKGGPNGPQRELPLPKPTGPDTWGQQQELPNVGPKTEEGLDLAIDNALEETMVELKKLAGL